MAFQSPVVVQTAKAHFHKADLAVPHISGGVNSAADKRINDAIKKSAQKLVDSQGSLQDPNAEMIGFYEQKTNEKDVLSLSLYNYAYTGGAHGLTLQDSLTFKQSTGETYTLAQLFKSGSDYVSRLNEIIAAQIKERDIAPIEPFKSIRPDQDFYIADRALVIYFQIYELTPYVFGFPYFPISVYDIEDIINEDGPLGQMVPND
ncbi:DUF3298 and DUF4163 domain-containing protein [Paenibacillus sp. YIM B09110]|uniref:DUF3298 and DUF4163 domain-containing protein n=1 Tax=Paenibacillus sp. YIM B09110 TaxID=3126102 RepID=UPI00301CD985